MRPRNHSLRRTALRRLDVAVPRSRPIWAKGCGARSDRGVPRTRRRPFAGVTSAIRHAGLSPIVLLRRAAG